MELKNIFSKKVLTLLSASILFCGCEDFLTRDHPTAITDDDFWGTVNECNAAFGQCKYWPRGTYHYDAPYFSLVHLEGATDNMYWSGNFKGEIANLGNGSATTTTGGYMNDLWTQYYLRIRRCNRFLEHVDAAYFVDEKERERMIADVRVWRAWYHIQLLMYYGMNDGIPIQDKVLNGDEIYKSRNTIDECLDFINSELDAVIAIQDPEGKVFPFVWDRDRRDRMCKAYALVLKMDVNLQFKRYDVAKAAAKAIIDNPDNNFSLYYSEETDDDPGKHYRDMFRYKGQDNKERIMYIGSGCSEAWFRNAPQSLSGQGAASVLRSLVDEYETADGVALKNLPAAEREKLEKNPLEVARDPRLYATVVMPGDNTSFLNYVYEPFKDGGADQVGKVGASRTGYWAKKFLDEQDRASGSGSLYFPLYRYAEVLLSYVECLVETGDWQNPDVEKYINMIRNRAGMPNMNKAVYNTQEKVRELYRRERRVELAFEGKRYFDIRRWDIGYETMNGAALGAWNPTTNTYVQVENRACTFPKYNAWPIPQAEETANPNIDQPTGW